MLKSVSQEKEIEELAVYLLWRMTQACGSMSWNERIRRMLLGRALFKFLASREK
jgi:hypothetical protein